MDTLDIVYKLVHEYGILALFALAEGIVIYYLFNELKKKTTQVDELVGKLLKFSEQRLEDVKEDRDDYAQLATRVDEHMDLLIKVFRQKGAK